jgi:hypothetical protein
MTTLTVLIVSIQKHEHDEHSHPPGAPGRGDWLPPPSWVSMRAATWHTWRLHGYDRYAIFAPSSSLRQRDLFPTFSQGADGAKARPKDDRIPHAHIFE